jgi:hypothetical protein
VDIPTPLYKRQKRRQADLWLHVWEMAATCSSILLDLLLLQLQTFVRGAAARVGADKLMPCAQAMAAQQPQVVFQAFSFEMYGAGLITPTADFPSEREEA